MPIYLGNTLLTGAGSGSSGGGGGSIPVNTYGVFFVDTNETMIETNDGSIWLRTGNTLTADGTMTLTDAGQYPFASQAVTAGTNSNLFTAGATSAFNTSSQGGGVTLDRLNNELLVVTQQSTTLVDVIRYSATPPYTSVAQTFDGIVTGTDDSSTTVASDGTTLYRLLRGPSNHDIDQRLRINGTDITGVVAATGTYPYTNDTTTIEFSGAGFTSRNNDRATLVWNGTHFWLGDGTELQQFDATGVHQSTITTAGEFVGSSNNTTFWSWSTDAKNGGTVREHNFSDGSETGVSFVGPSYTSNVVPQFGSPFEVAGDGVFMAFDYGPSSGFVQRWDEYVSVIGNSTALYSRGFGDVSGTIQAGADYRLYVKIGDAA